MSEESFSAGLRRKEAEEEQEEREEKEEQERLKAMALARADYDQEKARIKREEEQAECPHDELDHGICIDCGKDCIDDLIDRAELMRDSMEDR